MSGILSDGVSRASRATLATRDRRVEVGAHHDGIYDSLATDIAEA